MFRIYGSLSLKSSTYLSVCSFLNRELEKEAKLLLGRERRTQLHYSIQGMLTALFSWNSQTRLFWEDAYFYFREHLKRNHSHYTFIRENFLEKGNRIRWSTTTTERKYTWGYAIKPMWHFILLFCLLKTKYLLFCLFFFKIALYSHSTAL